MYTYPFKSNFLARICHKNNANQLMNAVNGNTTINEENSNDDDDMMKDRG
jgi:hypothetical protein